MSNALASAREEIDRLKSAVASLDSALVKSNEEVEALKAKLERVPKLTADKMFVLECWRAMGVEEDKLKRGYMDTSGTLTH